MRKILCLLLAIFCCSFVGCNDSKQGKKADSVISLNVCEEFYTKDIYAGDVVDLSEYLVNVEYKSGKTETVALSNMSIRYLDTRTVGENVLNITYKNKSEVVRYSVNALYVVDLIYKGNELTFYRGEKPNLEDLKITVLMNNGDEVSVDASGYISSEIDYSLTESNKSLEVSYGGEKELIPYRVTCMQIVEGTNYQFNDTLNIYMDNSKYVKLIEDYFYVYDENSEFLYSLKAKNESYNRYSVKASINGGFPKDIYVYLIGDTIYFEE